MAGRFLLLVSFLSLLLFRTDALPGENSRVSPRVVAEEGGLRIASYVHQNKVVPNRFIVVYNQNCSEEHIQEHQAVVTKLVARHNPGKRSLNGRALSTAIHPFALGVLRGMTVEGEDWLVNQVAEPSMVQYVEQDAYVRIQQQQEMVPVFNTSDAPVTMARLSGAGGGDTVQVITQSNAPSGLARLSSAIAGGAAYTFDPSAGSGITAFVVDTGILTGHNEFEGRASMGFNAVDNILSDLNGHGTHVAATIGGATFGVAKKINLVGVKVLDGEGEGTNSDVIAGMNFVAATVKSKGLAGKSVMNMSLGGSRSNAVNQAINALAAAGVVPVVAAGNEDQDTANTSPGSAQSAICVGAIDQRSDKRASFSNFGTGVDVHAPGVSVLSAGIANVSATKTLSGTSMASPHVAGLAAYLLGLDRTGMLATSSDVTDMIKKLAASSGASVKNNVRGTTNLIANNGILG